MVRFRLLILVEALFKKLKPNSEPHRQKTSMKEETTNMSFKLTSIKLN